jgi:hypothetical protein
MKPSVLALMLALTGATGAGVLAQPAAAEEHYTVSVNPGDHWVGSVSGLQPPHAHPSMAGVPVPNWSPTAPTPPRGWSGNQRAYRPPPLPGASPAVGGVGSPRLVL